MDVTHTVASVTSAKQLQLCNLSPPGKISMMCKFVACARREQIPQLKQLTGLRGSVGGQVGERLRDRDIRRETLKKMLLSRSGDCAGLPG